jgi:aspartate/tyrosine/aromatic aminotransferase
MSSFLARIEATPPDPIMGLLTAFEADPRPDKLNLGIGVYRDEAGRTPVLHCVKEAETRLLREETTKSYLPLRGHALFNRLVPELVLGPDHPAVVSGRVTCLQTTGGTGALRIAAELLRDLSAEATIHLTSPTWANHGKIFGVAGKKLAGLSWSPGDRPIDGGALVRDLDRAQPGDAVVLHGCCHNPTGLDPSRDLLSKISAALLERKTVPVVDLAYAGFGEGLEADLALVRRLAHDHPEIVICVSFSKNMGLYRDRVGALILVGRTPDAAERAAARAEVLVRALHSSPPSHGGTVVATILADTSLRALWHAELEEQRMRVETMRSLLRSELDGHGLVLSGEGSGFLTTGKGLFAVLPLTRETVEALRERHAIYLLLSGRINVAGLTAPAAPRLAQALADVGPRIAEPL